ncbi:MAG: hypothetical protein H6Q91_1272 [Deltaproteobacteria bacterium]|nr:hypothetical protein [Deltaproteobacteria bacterium]
MTVRSSAKRNAAKARGRRSNPLSRLEGQLPATLREYAAELRKRLDRLERDITKAQMEARRRAARLLREASHQLGRLEVAGEAGWRKLGASYQKDLVALLKRLEKAVAPPAARKPARKPARKKRVAGSRAAPAGSEATS